MDIYICIPEKLLVSSEPEVISELNGNIKRNLKKYYGDLSVFACISRDKTITVYVMGKPKYSGYESEIKDFFVKEIHNFFSDENIEVRLNYASFNPNFCPPKYEKNTMQLNQSVSWDNDRKSDISTKDKNNRSEEFDYEKLSFNYQAEEPRYSFDQVILPDKIRNQIEEAVGIIQVEKKVFDEWGLRSIIPTATSALSFYGPPGTGKSMAAEAVAQKVGKKILCATYADIESKYHGEGPKMVKAIFRAAEREDAVLFLDESDSLLSKRLTNVSDGTGQAINSMRSQLLISLERFKGIVIFATNLVVNYDKAFLSRLINIEFTMPNEEARKEIWLKHLKGENIHIPLGDDLNISELAEKYVFCGRDIKNAVKNACVSAALNGKDIVTQSDFMKACEKTKLESEKVIQANDHTNMKASLSKEQSDALKSVLQKKMDAANNCAIDSLNE